ncbi:MAG: response regulator [Planctomycetota bacterium]|jgi:CheY-like chemotaxis protein
MAEGRSGMYDIVAVDDCQAIRGLLSSVFEDMGLSSSVHGIPKEALSVIEREGAGILVTDINMPEMNGAELAERVREKNPDMPIIAITASVLESNLNPRDFTCMLKKPFKISSLVTVLSECMNTAGCEK